MIVRLCRLRNNVWSWFRSLSRTYQNFRSTTSCSKERWNPFSISWANIKIIRKMVRAWEALASSHWAKSVSFSLWSNNFSLTWLKYSIWLMQKLKSRQTSPKINTSNQYRTQMSSTALEIWPEIMVMFLNKDILKVLPETIKEARAQIRNLLPKNRKTWVKSCLVLDQVTCTST